MGKIERLRAKHSSSRCPKHSPIPNTSAHSVLPKIKAKKENKIEHFLQISINKYLLRTKVRNVGPKRQVLILIGIKLHKLQNQAIFGKFQTNIKFAEFCANFKLRLIFHLVFKCFSS